MKAPTLNTNGTSKESLCKTFEAAHLAIVRALIALEDCEPHGRDYSPDDLVQAKREHASMVARVLTVKDEIVKTWGDFLHDAKQEDKHSRK